MRKLSKIFFIIGIVFSLCLFTGCKLNKYETIDEKYTIRFVDNDGNIVKSVTNLVGESFDVAEIPQAPKIAGYTASWTLNGNADINYAAIQKNTIIRTGYTIDKFDVRFLDFDGTVIKTERVEWHSDAVAPANPTRTGYTFKSWDNAYTDVTDDIDVTATYDINVYHVTFKDHDGTVLKEQDIKYLEAATAPTEPTRTGYTFNSWDQAFNSITADIDVTATYDINVYKVTFKDHDGTVLKEEDVNYLNAATAPTDPVRTGYTFNSWDQAFNSITADIDVTATYDINVYKVTFKDHDGTVLKEEDVNYLNAATAPTDPVRTGYTFNSWDQAFNSITADIDVTATYDINVYHVTFKDYEGTVLKEEDVNYLDAATAPTEPSRLGHEFTGWDQAFDSITEDIIVTATYAPIKYKVSVELPLVLATGETGVFRQGFGSFDYDSINDLTERLNNIASATPGFTFSGWNKKIDEVTNVPLTQEELASFRIPNEDVVLVPNFTIISYNVVFKNYNGDLLDMQSVEYKHAATAPVVPDRVGYTFDKWDKDFSAVTQTMVVTAEFKINVYTVNFYGPDGNLLESQAVEYLSDAVAPVYDVTGYKYSWDNDYTAVTSDVDTNSTVVLKVYTIKIYVGDNEVTYVSLAGNPLHYQDIFIPDFTVVGALVFTGKLIVITDECVGGVPTNAEYNGAYVIEDVDVVVFRAELVPSE